VFVKVKKEKERKHHSAIRFPAKDRKKPGKDGFVKSSRGKARK